MTKHLVDAALFLLASPVLVLRSLLQALGRWRFLRAATAAGLRCDCGEEVSLLGLWRCPCGFTYRGHLMRACPVCGALPLVVRCYACGVTTKLPEAEP